MKRIFIISIIASLMMFLAKTSYSQDKFTTYENDNSKKNAVDLLPQKNGKVYYSDIIKVDSVSKVELYNRAKRWVVDIFNSAKDVTQLDNKEEGELIIKSYFLSDAYWVIINRLNIYNTIKIYVKDNRYKYEIVDISISFDNKEWMFPIETWYEKYSISSKSNYKKINTEFETIILSLENAMKTKSQLQENW